MTNQNLIHIKLTYGEAIQSKREILSLEQNSLRIAQIIKNYNLLRLKELQIKIKLYTRINSLLKDIKKIQKILPTIDLPEQFLEQTGLQLRTKSQRNNSNNIELQLQEIQDKLNALQQA